MREKDLWGVKELTFANGLKNELDWTFACDGAMLELDKGMVMGIHKFKSVG